MTSSDESLQSFRSEIPPAGQAAWTAVRDALAHEIAAELRPPVAERAAKRRRSPRLLGVALGALVLTGAAAYGAATLIGVGSPAPNPPSAFTPSNIKLLGLRVADPAGGPPWGIRLALSQPRADVHPNVAIQIGRIVGEQMGFVGRDNVFHDDRLFHAAGPNSALVTPADYPITGTPQKPNLQSVYHFALTLPGVASAYQGCSNVRVPTRERIHRPAIEQEVRALERELAILGANGSVAQREARSFGASVAALRLTVAEQLQHDREVATGFVTERTYATCPSADLRTIVFGFSGPQSTSITISGGNHSGLHQTERLRPDDDGFYLFVLPDRWSYGSRYQATVSCRDGRAVRGVAAPGTPDPPRCS